ncbi:hypothetical protein PH213_20310 [Streptomyces sp. SRF1]|uniref:hypothetical protein n=1 Tax=Streptomyces sp. SRF1 TaxID=1549642 RepID=UPI0025B062FA|nr:hypothetical protein [Streptomyces sp. SRF1]MDN3056850.1 hypothetical protein [Streptomyces sp. SRF1]
MAVEPIPCAPDGGSSTPVELTACCAPSIASTALCRADGTTMLLVVRSGCAECGQAAPDPEVIGWIDAASGTFTPGPAPADIGPCEAGGCYSPSITSAPLCRPDGSTLLVVVRSASAECGQDAGDPALAGWLDLATGTYTPGAPPADAGPCEAGCVDTVCRTRCDDTDGDGQADATFTELWCIRPDSTAELILTYQDDPSTPYTPVAPVECEYGCPQMETLTLCDDGGPFLRRITWLAGTATYEDTELDGQTPHVPAGTVTVCADTSGDAPCVEQTTPAATLGLCLPDGTPLAVLITRDCDGTVTQDGWLNLTTGQFTSGPPPAGAMACGDSRAFELAGLLCDVDPASGDVLGLVLVEYEYAADGSLASVRLVDPATGNTYTLQGELRHCPAGAGEEQPEQDIMVLCDVQADGTVTAFVRDYRRAAASGQITGHTDYTLDGQPYAPAGTVGVCHEPETADVESWPLCVVDDTSGLTVARVRRETVYDATGAATNTRLVDEATGAPYTLPAGAHLGECCQTTREAVCVTPLLPTSQRVVSNPGNNTSGRVDPAWTWGLTSAGGRAVYDVAAPGAWTTPLPAGGGWVSLTPTTATSPLPPGAPATYYMVTAFELPDDAVLDATTIKIDTLNADNSVWGYALNGAAETATDPRTTWFNQPPYTEAEHRIKGAVRGMNLLAIRVLESNPPSPGGVLLDVTLTYRVPGTPQYWTVEHRDCGTTTYIDPDGNRYEGGLPDGYMACGGGGGSSIPGECCPDADPLLLCDVAADGTSTPFLRHLTYTDGVLTSVTDTALDGVTDYTPTGTVGVCPAADGPEEPCRDSSTVLLCDLPAGGTPAPTVTDTAPTPYQGTGLGAVPVAGGAAALWSGGTLTIPATDTGPGPDHVNQRLRSFAATVQAPRLGCDTGTATVTASIRVQRTGPDDALGGNGLWDLYVAGTRVAAARTTTSAPVGYTDTLTVTAQVPAADLAAGNVLLAGALETWQTADHVGGWVVDHFTAAVEFDQTGCATQFLRNLTIDCETGAIVAVTDTTLDGKPYTVTGDVGQCTPAGDGSDPEPCRNTSTVLLCDDGGTPEKTARLASAQFQQGTGTLWNGVVWTATPAAATFSGTGSQTFTFSEPVRVRYAVTGLNGSSPTTTPRECVQLPAGTLVESLYENHQYDAAPHTVCNIAPCTSTADAVACQRGESLFRTPGKVTNLTVSGTDGTALIRGLAWLEATAGDPPTQFLRTFVTDCRSGETLSVVDTTLDGQPYTVVGEVSQCSPAGGSGGECCPLPEPEPCRDSSTVLLCDLPQAGEPEPTLTDTAPAPYYPYPEGKPATGGQTLWDGGTLNLPAGTGPQPGTIGAVNLLAATIQAPRPDCDDGTAHVTVSVDITQDGPDDGCGPTGHVRLFNGSAQVALAVLPANTPAGWTGTLTVAADVPAADLAAGTIAAAVALDAFDGSTSCTDAPRETAWTLANVAAKVVYAQAGCVTQFLRTLVVDCDSGQVMSVTDTTLDGEPYTVTGTVGQCSAAGGDGGGGACCPFPEPEPCPAQSVIEACRCDDTDGDGVADTDYLELLAVDCAGTLTSIGTYVCDLSAPYTPVAPVPCVSQDKGAEPAIGVQARRVELAVGASWSASTYAGLRSVTAVAHSGNGQIITTDGTSTLYAGESVTWSIDKDVDAALAGPLTITATDGVVTVTFTRRVNL